MYRILGKKGKEYGPVGAEAVKHWLIRGKVGAQTQLQKEGDFQWRSLSEFPEFQEALASGSATKESLPTSPEAPSSLGPRARTSRLAAASLVLGLFGITALVGLIFGVIAQIKISRSGGELKGSGLAIAGMVVSGFMFLISIPVMAGLFLPAYFKAQQSALEDRCAARAEQLVQAIRQYSQDHGGAYPPAASWCDTLTSAGLVPDRQTFVCPVRPQMACGYAFNKDLDGKVESAVTGDTVLIFESDGRWNAHGGSDAMATTRHGFEVIVGFVDGRVERVPGWQLRQLRWAP
jgi:Domain of unknown function (DUF4190)